MSIPITQRTIGQLEAVFGERDTIRQHIVGNDCQCAAWIDGSFIRSLDRPQEAKQFPRRGSQNTGRVSANSRPHEPAYFFKKLQIFCIASTFDKAAGTAKQASRFLETTCPDNRNGKPAIAQLARRQTIPPPLVYSRGKIIALEGFKTLGQINLTANFVGINREIRAHLRQDTGEGPLHAVQIFIRCRSCIQPLDTNAGHKRVVAETNRMVIHQRHVGDVHKAIFNQVSLGNDICGNRR